MTNDIRWETQQVQRAVLEITQIYTLSKWRKELGQQGHPNALSWHSPEREIPSYLLRDATTMTSRRKNILRVQTESYRKGYFSSRSVLVVIRRRKF